MRKAFFFLLIVKVLFLLDNRPIVYFFILLLIYFEENEGRDVEGGRWKIKGGEKDVVLREIRGKYGRGQGSECWEGHVGDILEE